MVRPRFRTQLRLANVSFVLLLCAAVGVLMVLSARYPARWDWTATGRNSLSPASAQLLKTLQGPITVRVFLGDNTSARNRVRRLINRYRQVKPDIQLTFVNPARHPNQVRTAGIQFQGEAQLGYQHRTAVVSQPSEQTLTNTLAGLARSGLTKLVFAVGNGERNPGNSAPFDLSAWAHQLKARGLKIGHTHLSGRTPLIPGKSVLVLASPQAKLLPGQVTIVRNFVHAGGDLLWLQDPGPLQGLQPLAAQLHLRLLPGELVDPTSQVLTGRADFLAILHYGHDPIVSGLHIVTVFPSARALQLQTESGPWHATPFLMSNAGSWESTHPGTGAVRYNPPRDIPGPLPLGYSLERQHQGRAQRVVVMGNGSFMANTVLGQGGNLQLAMNIANWLTHDDAEINLPSRQAPDSRLLLTPHQQMGIALLFLLVLPVSLFSAAGILWWRRRRG
ncbi:MAG TPA: DUF4350 domain-containing protein [Acidiferrobacteraceae bacterium]|nr:DUF4350 domain-containing protein [Acidiferrobacteraceae bacterium]